MIKIGTRESKLAVVQAEIVADAIRRDNPDIEVRIVTMKTMGDKILNKTLDKVGGKGLFVKELDEALRRGDVDLCVHSYKDMPSDWDTALPVVAVGQRADPRDVLILPEGITALDPAKPVGCSSLRRQVQLQKLYPGQPIAPVRGNVLTRLEKLDRGEFSALVLAAAGIQRLGLDQRISRIFATEELLPAACQGVLAVQGRAGEDHSYLKAFHHPETEDTTVAERAFVRRLDCGCGAPVGAYAIVEDGQIQLTGMITGRDGTIYKDSIAGPRASAEALGIALVLHMLERREQDER